MSVQKNSKIGMVKAFFDAQKEKMVFADVEHPELIPVTLAPEMIEDIYSGKEKSTIQATNIGDAVVGIVPVFSFAVPSEVIGRISVSYVVPKGFVDKLRSIADASGQYRHDKASEKPDQIQLYDYPVHSYSGDYISGDMVRVDSGQGNNRSYSGSCSGYQ